MGDECSSEAFKTFKKDCANIEFFELGAVSLTLPVLPEDNTDLALKFRLSFKPSLIDLRSSLSARSNMFNPLNFPPT